MLKLTLFIAFGLPLVFLGGCAQLNPSAPPSAVPDLIANPDDLHKRAPSARSLEESLDEHLAQEAEHEDIWSRIRSGYGLPDVDRNRIDNHLRWYANNQQHLDNVTLRSEPYIHYIVSELEARDMPLELALLPVIESSYNPFAHSPSRAAGIWQFMPQTGRNFGLKQDNWYDGRRDLIASTDAALRYLQRLHQMFDGDWLLAIAAYNAGEGRLMRAIRQNRAQGKPTDFWSLPLPEQTRAYVPRLLALSRIIADPDNYELTLNDVPNEPYFTLIEVDGQINLAQAAELADIDPEDLQRLNAGYSRWLTTHHNNHQVLVPLADAENFSEQLGKLPRVPETREYKVVKGDTLGAIAKRFNTSVAQIKSQNRLTSDRLSIGQSLIVAGTPPHLLTTDLPTAEERMQNYGTNRRTANRYSVRPGDSLWKIARQHDTSVAELRRLNNLGNNTRLKPGQQLLVNSTSRKTLRPTEDPNKVLYEIQHGDTLHRIAQRFKVTPGDILQWNSIKDATYIHPGQTLTLIIKN